MYSLEHQLWSVDVVDQSGHRQEVLVVGQELLHAERL